MPKQARVLVMDDDEMVCNIAMEMLEEGGYSVATASDGEQMIEMYKQSLDAPFDVVIMDLTIPGGMGGKEAIQHLLKIDPQAKAIVSSGYDDDPVSANYATYGFKGVVSKPYTINQLWGVLNAVLKN